jgi:hypothetical protein
MAGLDRGIAARTKLFNRRNAKPRITKRIVADIDAMVKVARLLVGSRPLAASGMSSTP